MEAYYALTKRMTLMGVAVVSLSGITYTAQTANASTYSTVSSTTMTKTAYHKKSTTGAVYNASHTKGCYAKGLPNTTWYATKKVVLKHNGKNAIYYQVKNGAGTKSGIIWHSYLTKGVAPFNVKYAKMRSHTMPPTIRLSGQRVLTRLAIASVSKLMTLYLVDKGRRFWLLMEFKS